MMLHAGQPGSLLARQPKTSSDLAEAFAECLGRGMGVVTEELDNMPIGDGSGGCLPFSQLA
jgi:hypothetical protein